MTEKNKIFADEYLIDFNATRAYKAAYPHIKKDETARTNASRLLTKANIQSYIDERIKERRQRTEITQDQVVEELAAIAFAKATDYATIHAGLVRIKDTDSLSEAQVRAIAGIKEGANGIEIKLSNKEKALELLGRHLGMFKDRVEVSGMEQEKSRLDDILKQMRGDGS